MSDLLLIFLVAPALITALLLMYAHRSENGEPVEFWEAADWEALGFFSLFYPFGLFVLFCEYVWPLLLRERRWFWRDQ